MNTNRRILLSLTISLGLLGCSGDNLNSDPSRAGEGPPIEVDADIPDTTDNARHGKRRPGDMLSCIDNGFNELWNVSNFHGAIAAIALSGDGILAVASLDGSLKQWHVGLSGDEAPLPNGQPSYGTTFADESEGVTALVFANDGKRLFGGDQLGNIAIWSTSDASHISTTSLSEFDVKTIAVDPSGPDLVMADSQHQRNLRLWNHESKQTSEPLATRIWQHGKIQYNADGSRFVVAGLHYGVYAIELWDRDDLTRDASYWQHHDGHDYSMFQDVTYSEDGSYIVAVGSHDVMVFDPDDLEAGPLALLNVRDANFNSVVAVGELIAVTSKDDTLRLLQFDANAAHLSEVASTTVAGPVGIALDASGKRLFWAGEDGRIRALACKENE